MRVIHITSSDLGGAGRACVRLHNALLRQNIDSIILTNNKTLSQKSIERVARTKLQKIGEKLRVHISQMPLALYPKRHKDIFSPNLPLFNMKNKTLIKRINELNPDIVHLHWIEAGFINIADLRKIEAPLIWSLHDENPYSGGCHYVENDCQKYKSTCEQCPLLNAKSRFDLGFWTFKRKQKTYENVNLTINGLSTWIKNKAQASALFKDKRIINLPNPIDIDVYKPIDKKIAREILNIKSDKKIICFGAINGGEIKRKGFGELKSALSLIASRDIALMTFGGEMENSDISLGYINDDITLALIYSACDAFIVPSLNENLSNAIMEALSCGAPVIAFDIGGNSDMIKHLINGYLAKNVKDLARGIEWILDSKEYNKISQNARQSVINKFSFEIVARLYIREYEFIREREQNLASFALYYFESSEFNFALYFESRAKSSFESASKSHARRVA